jgi:hypothetical protein
MFKWIKDLFGFENAEDAKRRASLRRQFIEEQVGRIARDLERERRALAIRKNQIEAGKILMNILGLEEYEKYRANQDVPGILRAAERKTHLDLGGSKDDFLRVQEARKLLLS